MMRWFGAAILAVAVMAGGSAASPAASADMKKLEARQASNRSGRHLHLYRDHDAYWPSSDPRYYGRPYYYAPAPFVPLPPLFGYGWEPW